MKPIAPKVLFAPADGGPYPLSQRLRRKSKLWGCRRRNKLVAALAVGLVNSARTALRLLGVPRDAVELAPRVRQRVTILVESPAQLRALADLLPTWEERDLVPSAVEPPDPAEPDPDENPPPGRIVTLTHAARYGLRADVLIRATAGTGKLAWETILGGAGRPGTSPALLVDIADVADPRGRADALARRREYLSQGLSVLRHVRAEDRDALMSQFLCPRTPVSFRKHTAGVGAGGNTPIPSGRATTRPRPGR